MDLPPSPLGVNSMRRNELIFAEASGNVKCLVAFLSVLQHHLLIRLSPELRTSEVLSHPRAQMTMAVRDSSSQNGLRFPILILVIHFANC